MAFWNTCQILYRRGSVTCIFKYPYKPDEQKANAKSYVSASTGGFLNRNEALDWEFLKRLRDFWPKKLQIKCVLHPEDAATAVTCGVDGIFVSNHAGNVNDSAITAWDALPAISDAIGGKAIIIADTGVRRGSDVIKGLALGADVIAVGRSTLYGLQLRAKLVLPELLRF